MDSIWVGLPRDGIVFASDRGTLAIALMQDQGFPYRFVSWSSDTPPPQQTIIDDWKYNGAEFDILGFGFVKGHDFVGVCCPWWSACCMTTIVGFFFLRMRSPSSRCHCTSCDYDLRASPTRCPECGTTVKLSDNVLAKSLTDESPA